MGLSPKNTPRTPYYLLPLVAALALTGCFLYNVDSFISKTKTVAGHNLNPTPWHLFEPKTFSEDSRQIRVFKIFHCSYLACHSSNNSVTKRRRFHSSKSSEKCPEFFRWIHQDLEPWARTGISKAHLAEAQKYAAFRVVIVGGFVLRVCAKPSHVYYMGVVAASQEVSWDGT